MDPKPINPNDFNVKKGTNGDFDVEKKSSDESKIYLDGDFNDSYEARIRRGKKEPKMSEESQRKFSGCDTPLGEGVIQNGCNQEPVNNMKIRVGRDTEAGQIILDVAGRIVHLQKEGALQLGQLLIEEALKL